MKNWSFIFSSILIACDSKSDDSASDTGDAVVNTCEGVDCYGECLTPYEETRDYTLTEEEFATYLEEDGTLSAEGCTNICIEKTQYMYDQNVNEVLSCVHEPVDGNASVTCEMIVQPYCEGRFHDGVPRPRNQSGNDVQQWLSRAAQSERASVQSFVLLARELQSHQAPQSLIDRLMKAAREEVIHARMMSHQCTKHNAQIPHLEESTLPQRTLFDIAVENAVEGCVHERYAALQAHHQAHYAQDAELRKTFLRIAQEETEHTTLAEDLHIWFMSQLTEPEQECVRKAKLEAQQELEKSLLCRSADPEMLLYLGLPCAQKSHEIAQRLHRIAV